VRLITKNATAKLTIAPIAPFAVDYYVAEVPHKAKQGQAYKMLVKSNCRWESGMCDLINGDLKVNITSDTQTYGLNRLFINASNGLKGIKFAVVEKIIPKKPFFTKQFSRSLCAGLIKKAPYK
jgi:hypothetical protein